MDKCIEKEHVNGFLAACAALSHASYPAVDDISEKAKSLQMAPQQRLDWPPIKASLKIELLLAIYFTYFRAQLQQFL